MANRRMFSLRIINSARFLKMPVSARLLYYDLGMRADDDGIVEAFTMIRMVGCTEDDLRVLVAKGFVQVLNEDLITYITDWNENNKIRPDRKIDSIYKDLLLKIVPDVPLIEKKERADAKRTDNGQTMDGQWTDNGQPMDGIGKDRLGKERIVKDSLDNNEQSEIAHESVKERFEYLWDIYPNKKGKKRAFEAFQRALKKGVTIDQIRDGIKAYNKYIKESGIEQRYVKQGSTFFMQESWNDDWTPTKEQPKNKFNQFEQNTYDFDELEKDLGIT